MQKLASISDRFLEVEKQVGDPEVIADQKRYRDLMREYKRLGPIVDQFKELRAWESDRKQAEAWGFKIPSRSQASDHAAFPVVD